MASTSMGTVVLEAVEELSELIRAIYQVGPHEAPSSLQKAMKVLGNLEQLAERRVDRSTYEAHRRRMEVCHIVLPEQARLV